MKQHRAETGPMQFGEDWKGVFIRGDNAFAFAQYLKAILPHISFTNDFFAKGYIEELIRILEKSNQYTGSNPQKMKPFEECIDGMENVTTRKV